MFNTLLTFVNTLSLQVGLEKKREGSRKQIKEKKNRDKKVFGVGRRIAKHKAKKAAKA
jgi:small subunit ribosomal protein S24e